MCEIVPLPVRIRGIIMPNNVSGHMHHKQDYKLC